MKLSRECQVCREVLYQLWEGFRQASMEFECAGEFGGQPGQAGGLEGPQQAGEG